MRIQITDTTLRDAHQSLIATRMRTKDMLPIAEKLDAVGFFSLEVWGGATFDSCIRYLNEDPWDRLKALRAKVKNTRLQMLLRGQNLVGYRHYSDDVVREFIRLSVKNGVDVFRVFDALNDIRNMELSIQVAKSYGVHVQGTICYTTSPVHSVEGFAEMAVKLQELGSDSVCIKDMAGLITLSLLQRDGASQLPCGGSGWRRYPRYRVLGFRLGQLPAHHGKRGGGSSGHSL
jgi:pyruvate carboxylase subunit B